MTAIVSLVMLNSLLAFYPETQEWSMRASDDPAKAHFSINKRDGNHNWQSSSTIPWSAFRGINAETLKKNQTGIRFEMVRDAGKLLCEGQVYGGRGLGSFEFQPNPAYASELSKLGYEAPSSDRLFTMAMIDVSLEFARGVRDAGLKATTKELVDLRIHGTTLEYLSQIRALGYTDLTAKQAVDMRIHGVQPDFLKYLKDAGYTATVKEAIDLRIHGVTPELVAELKKAGYDVTMRQVVDFRIHGVTPQYIQELNSLGFKPTPRELVDLRIHGVTTNFIKESRAMGYKFSTKELTQLRIHGADTAYLKKLETAGYKNLSADQIQRLRIHGVD